MELWGWKVHVSACFDEASTVLELVAETAIRAAVSFKYLRSERAYLYLHAKASSRLQSGKFIALYPSDVRIARELMDDLHYILGDRVGPKVLTDRPYRESKVISYRWGAFASSSRVNEDGVPEDLVPDGTGRLVADTRLPRFTLPAGITDPFQPTVGSPSHTTPHAVALGRYLVQKAYRFTNAGGVYSALDRETGQSVVLKEARPHTGFVGRESAVQRLRREAGWLRRCAEIRERLAPALLDEFSSEGHHFLAMEQVPGVGMHDWISQANPLYTSEHASRTAFEDYLTIVTPILDSVRADLDVLHVHGIAFGDVSPSNIQVDSQGRARLIDFENCSPVGSHEPAIGTPDFCLVQPRWRRSARERDEYGFHALRLATILRLTTLTEVSGAALAHLEEDLVSAVGFLPEWWPESRTHVEHVCATESVLRRAHPQWRARHPTERELIRELLVDGLTSCITDSPTWIFRSSQEAGNGAFLSKSYGDAGILATLCDTAPSIAESLGPRFVRQLHGGLSDGALPLGQSCGIAGMLRSLRKLGAAPLIHNCVEVLIRRVDRASGPELGRGLAGIAIELAACGRRQAAVEVMSRALSTSVAHSWSSNGLEKGRSGVIAAGAQLYRRSDCPAEWPDIIDALLDEEKAQIHHDGRYSRSLRSEPDGHRVMPYLRAGSAGLVVTACLLESYRDIADDLTSSLDESLMRELVADLATPFTLEGTLLNGAAGMLVAIDFARRTFPSLRAETTAADWGRLDKYLVPLGRHGGLGTVNPRNQRFDAGYDAGSSGILAALLWKDGLADLDILGLTIPCREL